MQLGIGEMKSVLGTKGMRVSKEQDSHENLARARQVCGSRLPKNQGWVKQSVLSMTMYLKIFPVFRTPLTQGAKVKL